MRFHLGAIPSSPDFVPDASWRSLREPSPWLANLLSLPIGIVAAAVVAVLWFLVTPLRDVTPAIFLPAFLLSFAGIVVVHELIHALVNPTAGRSPHSILGLWPAGGFFYAHYDGELSRNRFVAILLMPLLIISIVPLLVSAVTQVSSGWAAFVSVFNAFLACVDMLQAGLVLFQIPATRIARQKSWRTYWREHDTLAAS
jgi:Putative zincin peptidase